MQTPSLPYEFDVFVSYRRHGEWPAWVQEHFKPIFENYLTDDLGRDARVFVDTRLESGSQWPEHLALAHARSAVLVPLWSKTYFNSPWCRNELALMHAREKACGYRTASRRDVLVLPATIHDRLDFPKYAQGIQWLALNKYANVRLSHHGQAAEDLTNLIKAWTPTVAAAIDRAPSTCDPAWLDLSVREFVALFQAVSAKQERVPAFGQQ